jgi:DNA-binding transcriptional LysR family regulator
MELAWLEVFREVAGRGSLTGAAQALGYTQPAVSRQMTALEKSTGTRLFDRLPRGIRLTEEGRCLLGHAEAVLDRVHVARLDLAALRDLEAGRVRVGGIDSANAVLIPRALAALRDAHPKLTLSVTEGTSPALLDRLRDGELEVAVISDSAPQLADPGPYDLHELLDDPLLVALPDDHRLAAAGPLRLAELAEESWIEGFPGGSQLLTDACLRAGFRPRIDFAPREWIAKQGFVAAGLGLALVPLLAAGSVIPGLVLRRLHPDDAPVRRIRSVTLRAVATTPAVAACLDHLAQTARQLASAKF